MASLASTGPAWAQNVAPSAVGGDSNVVGEPQSTDIVVTARKTSERLANVGLSITAATGSELSERGITSVDGLVRLEPSLQFAKTSDSTPVYTLRGVGYNESSIQAPPTPTR